MKKHSFHLRIHADKQTVSVTRNAADVHARVLASRDLALRRDLVTACEELVHEINQLAIVIGELIWPDSGAAADMTVEELTQRYNMLDADYLRCHRIAQAREADKQQRLEDMKRMLRCNPQAHLRPRRPSRVLRRRVPLLPEYAAAAE